MFKRERSNEDFAEEIRTHLELEADELKHEGLSDAEARRKARVEFGNVGAARERFYLRGRLVWLDNFSRDLRYALRQLVKNPGFAFTAILVLALGIGASLAIFAFVDAALIRPLPYTDPQRLVHVTESDAAIARANLSYQDFQDWKRMNTVLSSMDAFTGWNYLLTTATGTEPLPGVRVSAGFFRTLGIVPILGRDFAPSEEVVGGPRAVMLTYGTWQRRFGGRNDIAGQLVKLSGIAYTIVGVLPRNFSFAPSHDAEIWGAMQPDNGCEEHRDCHNLYAIGRLKEGVTLSQASADMQSIAKQLEMQYPDSNRGRGASVTTLSKRVVGDIRPVLLLLFSGAGLLLLIAFVSVSSLLVVHSERRKREIAVRGALGASRVRIASQMIAEGLVLVGCGLAAGLIAAAGAMQLLSRLLSKEMLANMPYLGGIGMNSHLLFFAAFLAALAVTVFSAIPIAHLFSSDMRAGLADGGRTAAGTLWRGIGSRLVVIEIATTMVLLTGAGLLGKSLYRLLHVDVGFAADHLATLHVRLPDAQFPGDAEQSRFTRQLLDKVGSLPGVQTAAIASLLPVSCNCNTDWVRVQGRPYNGEHNTVNDREVSAGYFTAIRAKLLAGRYFTDEEDASKPKVMVVNHAFVRKYLAGEDAIGKMVGDTELSPGSMKRIVGVVEDFKDASLDEEQWPAVYYPISQGPTPSFVLIARTAQDEQSLLPALTAAVRQLNVDVGVDEGLTMIEHIDTSQTAYFHRAAAYLVGGFATLALLLSTIGLYGVIAYSVGQRTREIGVRMALGAQRRSVQSMVLREAGWLAAVGIAIGAVGALSSGRLLRGLLFGVSAWDVSTLLGVAAVLGAAALLASSIPAHRAASVNPVEALRAE